MNPKIAKQRKVLFWDVCGDITPKEHALARSVPMVVGDGMMFVPMWLGGLVLLLMTIFVHMSLMMTTILKYWPRTRNT